MLAAGFMDISFDNHRMTALPDNFGFGSDVFFGGDRQVMDCQVRGYCSKTIRAFAVGKSAHCRIKKNCQNASVWNINIIVNEWCIRYADSPAVVMLLSAHAECGA